MRLSCGTAENGETDVRRQLYADKKINREKIFMHKQEKLASPKAVMSLKVCKQPPSSSGFCYKAQALSVFKALLSFRHS